MAKTTRLLSREKLKGDIRAGESWPAGFESVRLRKVFNRYVRGFGCIVELRVLSSSHTQARDQKHYSTKSEASGYEKEPRRSFRFRQRVLTRFIVPIQFG